MGNIHSSTLILGSGAAGLTAAIYTARANLKPTLIHGIQPGGQMTITTDVENYPGFADVIQGPWLMEQMSAQAENVGTNMINDIITEASLSSKPFELTGDSGNKYTCEALIISTGAQAKWLGLESEDKFLGFGGRALKPIVLQNNPNYASQYIWSDAVYIKHVLKIPELDNAELLKLAVLSAVYGSADLVHYCLSIFDKKNSSSLSKLFIGTA